jgi:uncharacterized SAM-dependent methyltransferase
MVDGPSFDEGSPSDIIPPADRSHDFADRIRFWTKAGTPAAHLLRVANEPKDQAKPGSPGSRSERYVLPAFMLALPGSQAPTGGPWLPPQEAKVPPLSRPPAGTGRLLPAVGTVGGVVGLSIGLSSDTQRVFSLNVVGPDGASAPYDAEYSSDSQTVTISRKDDWTDWLFATPKPVATYTVKGYPGQRQDVFSGNQPIANFAIGRDGSLTFTSLVAWEELGKVAAGFPKRVPGTSVAVNDQQEYDIAVRMAKEGKGSAAIETALAEQRTDRRAPSLRDRIGAALRRLKAGQAAARLDSTLNAPHDPEPGKQVGAGPDGPNDVLLTPATLFGQWPTEWDPNKQAVADLMYRRGISKAAIIASFSGARYSDFDGRVSDPPKIRITASGAPPNGSRPPKSVQPGDGASAPLTPVVTGPAGGGVTDTIINATSQPSLLVATPTSDILQERTFLASSLNWFLGTQSCHMGPHQYAAHSGMRDGRTMSGAFLWAEAEAGRHAAGGNMVNAETNLLLTKVVAELGHNVRHGTAVIELGPGTTTAFKNKTLPVIRELGATTVVLVDQSIAFLKEIARTDELAPGLHIKPVVDDFFENESAYLDSDEPALICSFGSTISNIVNPISPDLPYDALKNSLSKMACAANKGWLLVAFDSDQDGERIKSYFKKHGLFQLNIFDRMVVELPIQGDFDPKAFTYEPEWNATSGQLAHIAVANRDMTFRLAGTDITLREGQKLQIKNSYKFTPEFFEECCKRAGLEVVKAWSDSTAKIYLLKIPPRQRAPR